MNSKSGAAEPLGGVVIEGIMHQVPVSRVELEATISDGVHLDAELTELNNQVKARGATTEEVIAAHVAEARRLQDELDKERGPLLALVAAKEAKLNQVKEKLFNLVKPLMGEQKSMKVTGIAGAIHVERSPKMEVTPAQIPTLRKLLGEEFALYFETKETAKPLSRAWDLLRLLKGRKLTAFQAAVSTSESGRVRFLADGK